MFTCKLKSFHSQVPKRFERFHLNDTPYCLNTYAGRDILKKKYHVSNAFKSRNPIFHRLAKPLYIYFYSLWFYVSYNNGLVIITDEQRAMSKN